jgi:ribosome-associated heat shock protein Hsp15
LRFDVALFELRLAKSRTQAAETIRDGHALLNGEAVKPSHELRAGDRVTLAGGPAPRTVEVLELPRGSLSREKARALLRDVGPGEAPPAPGPAAAGR